MPVLNSLTASEEKVVSAGDFIIERLSAEHLPDLGWLYELVFGVRKPLSFFQKKYDTAYTGVEYAGLIAYDRERMPVAYNGVIPCIIQDGDQFIVAGQAAEFMTHPDFRHKGLYVELSNLVFALCRSLGISLLFGFPNQHSYHGAVHRLGWKMTEELVCFSIPVAGFPLRKIVEKVPFARSYYKRHAEKVLSHEKSLLKGVANSAMNDGYAGICRSRRYFEHKSYSTAIVAAIGNVRVWFKTGHQLLIGDMEGLNKENFLATIAGLKKLARKLGLRQIQFHGSPGTTISKLFAAHYTAGISYPVLFQNFNSPISPSRIKFSFADIDIF